MTHQYLLVFPANQTLTGLSAIASAIRTSPLVKNASMVDHQPFAASRVDLRDLGGLWLGTALRRSMAFDQVHLFEAFDAVRRTPGFQDANNLKPVRVVIIDSGFDPVFPSEFSFGGDSIVTHLERNAAGRFVSAGPRDLDDHGTPIAGIVAALNDDSAMSGALTGIYRRGERPKVEVIVYGCRSAARRLDPVCENAALRNLARRMATDSTPTIVNMSSGRSHANNPQLFNQQSSYWRQMFAAFAPRETVFVTAAGNDGVSTEKTLPAAAADAAPNGLSVAATGFIAERAAFTGAARELVRNDVDCGTHTAGSNCGPGVTLAAPGLGIFSTSARGSGYLPLEDSSGTSFAAPIVTAVAALLQAIRPVEATPIPAAEIKERLQRTGDILGEAFTPGPVRRLNALSAVRDQLGPATHQRMFVTDESAGGVLGGVVAIDIDSRGRRIRWSVNRHGRRSGT